MAAVAAPPPETPRSGREQLFGGEPTGFLTEDINKNQPRYLVQMGWHCLSLNSPGIVGGRLWRAEIMPINTAAVVEHRASVPESMRIPGTDHAGPDGIVALTKYRRYAWDEAERLLMEDDNAANLGRSNGLVEVKSLYSDLGNRIYREINLTELFFPNWPHSLPDRNDDLIAQLMQRVEWVVDNPPASIPSNLINMVHPVLLEVGQELIEAAKFAGRLQRNEIMQTHLKMKLPRTDKGHKQQYDPRDFEILTRTGLPPLDQHEVTQAEALQKLTDNSLNGSTQIQSLLEQNAQMMQMIAAQNAQTQQLLQVLLADRLPKTDSEEEKTPKGSKGKS